MRALSSEAFEDGGNIPIKYTCGGQDISPPLSWSEPPEGTVSFVLIVEDPDAPMGVFTQWVIYNIPASLRKLPEGIPTKGEVEGIGVQGKKTSISLVMEDHALQRAQLIGTSSSSTR